MKKRDRIRFARLDAIEKEFQDLLIPCLQRCAAGRWGLFGAYDAFPGFENWWPEANRLRDLASQIQTMRRELGEQNDLCEAFLTRCTLHNSNDPGEPKLAKSFLEEIEHHHAEVER